KDATMDRLQPVSRIGKRAPYDHAHRVIQITALHFFFYIDWNFLGCFSHSSSFSFVSSLQPTASRRYLVTPQSGSRGSAPAKPQLLQPKLCCVAFLRPHLSIYREACEKF